MEKEIIIKQDPKSPISEIFRTLRTNLQFMTSNKGLKTLLVTSCVPGEGKSWVSANLVATFAQEGKKVVIVDSDMRKGRIHSIFEIDKKPGLSNYLSGVAEIEDKDNILNYIKESNIENVYVIPAGDVPPNPSELLVSDKMKELLQQLKAMFDLVIFDGTPCLLVTDSLILARQVDATVVVTAYKSTKLGEVEKIKKSIENVGGKIAGIIINKIPISPKKYQSTYYYGNTGEKQEEQEEETKTIEGKTEAQEIPTDIIEEIEREIQEFKQSKDKGE